MEESTNNLNSISYQDFFHAFGYGPNDVIYLRTLDDKKRTSYGKNYQVALKNIDSLIPELQKDNRTERGVFFVVNGGGQEDKDVKIARAQFMEIDDLSFDDQYMLINAFPLEPSIIIKTRKSLHCYWILTGRDIGRFTDLQARLAQYFGGDSSIKNPSRVMRLYGFYHQKEDPVMVELVKFKPDLRYGQQEFDDILPQIEKPPTKNSKKALERTGEKVPHGKRDAYVMRRCGELVKKLGKVLSPEAILEAVIADYYENCEDPDDRDEDNETFRENTLRKIKDCIEKDEAKAEAEQLDPDFYKYSMKAWREENPGVDFDSSGASWDDVAAAGLRAKEAGKVFDQIRTRTKDPPSVRTSSEEDNDQEGSKGTESAEPEEEADQDPEEGDLEQFHLHDAKGRITGVFDYEIHRYLKETEHIFIMGKIPYIYASGAYRADESGATLMTMIKRLMYPRFVKSNTIRRIYDLFISDAELQKSFEDLNQYPEEWICFKNGFYDPVNKCLVEHDPKYYAINQLPIEYDPAAAPEGHTVNTWLKFICEDPEEREMLLEYAGYCMNRDTRQQKFLILVGEGGTGKSTVISMIEKMIGQENISGISLVRLNQRFVSYNLLGKLLNSCADLEVSALEDVTTLKKLSGEDFIGGEPKGKPEIRFKSYAKLIFSTNELPIVKAEKTKGFYRRLLVLRMDKLPERRDNNFLELLAREHDYFIHECVEALSRMYERGSIVESKSSQEEVERLRMDSDTVEAFLAEETVPDPHGFIIRSQLFNAYTEYCRDMERTAYTKNNFFKSMRIKGYSEAKVNSGIQRGMVAFRGISFRNFAAENAAEDFQDLEEVPNPFSLISGSGE